MKGTGIVKRLLYSRLIKITVFGILVHSCIISSECEGYAEEANVHLKLEHGGGRGYEGHRIYISKTESYGSDYIQFKSTEVTAPTIYYVEPNMLYVRDDDGFYVTDIKSWQFKIKRINHLYPSSLTMPCDSATYCNFRSSMKNIGRIDSCLNSKADYKIYFYDDATRFSVFNSEKKLILDCTTVHWLF